MFDISSLQYNSENPTLIAVGFTVVCALLLGVLIAFTYERTSKYVNRPDHFIQAMVLVTIVSATIIQGIGDSVARGLGMLGALSIIRFRTTVRDPRNIVFMFSAIAAGIACGVLGFTIAICGTVAFCITAFILRFSSFNRSDMLMAVLKLEIDKNNLNEASIVKLIKKFSRKSKMKNLKYYMKPEKLNLIQKTYNLKLKPNSDIENMVKSFENLEGVNVVEFEIKDTAFDNI